MDIPKNIGTLESLKQRESKAFDEEAKWHDTLDDAYEYFLPQRNLFNREDKGQKKTDRIFDGTAAESIQGGASKLQEYIAPIWSRWANLEPSNQVLKLIEQSDGQVSEDDIRENLEREAEIVFDYINRSNFGTQFYEFGLDLLIGTATLMVDEGDSEEDPLIFSAIPQKGIGFEEGPHGNIESHFRRFKVKARNIERKWPGFESSEQLSDQIKDSPNADIDLSEAVIYDHKDKVYWGLVWVKDEDKVSWVQGFDNSSPWVTARYSKTSGEVRGRGPCLQVLPDVRTLNKAKEFSLTKAAIDLSGIWTATDDGVTNPYNFQVAPGIVIPVGSNNTTNPSIARLNTQGDLNLAQFVISDLQNTIKRALFADLREPSDSVVSATQYAIEARELAKRIGSAFGRIQTEALIPILKRVHWILKRKGLVNPISIGGTEVAIKFTSPLAKAQDAEDLMSVQQAVEFTLNTAGEEAVSLSFKVEDFGSWAGQKTGMPQELIRSDAEKQEFTQAASAAMQPPQEMPVEQLPQEGVI